MPDLDLTTDHKAAARERADAYGVEYSVGATPLDLRTVESAQGSLLVAFWNILRRLFVIWAIMLPLIVPLIGFVLARGSEAAVQVAVPALKYLMSGVNLYLALRFVLPSFLDIFRMLIGVSYYRIPGENPWNAVEAVELRWAGVRRDWAWLTRMFDARP
ncbi:MAG TPA: hypothetical protein PLI43_07110 [Albidovulum sp.]|uniref:hypothetical protein n=1 Tax=Albidovulum sp. TaxID=1872424 RepID=UPI002C1A44DD|nr:hypothetical protein [Albidovulum sp.]